MQIMQTLHDLRSSYVPEDVAHIGFARLKNNVFFINFVYFPKSA